MQFINQQIDRCRCFLCAEPITGPTCSRCGHLHDVRKHKYLVALRDFVLRWKNRYARTGAPAAGDDAELKLSTSVLQLIRDVQETSFACGAHDEEAEVPYEAVFQDSVAAGRALSEYVMHLEAAADGMTALLAEECLWSPAAQAAVRELQQLDQLRRGNA